MLPLPRPGIARRGGRVHRKSSAPRGLADQATSTVSLLPRGLARDSHRAFWETVVAAVKWKTSRASRGVAVAASPRAHHVARDRLLEAARGLVHVHGPLASSPRATRSRSSAQSPDPRHPRACEPESRGARLSWRRDGIRRGSLRGGCASPPCRLAARRDARRGGGRGVRRRAAPSAGAVPRRCGGGGSGRPR